MPSISLTKRFIFIHIPKTAGTSFSLMWKQNGYIAADEWQNWYLADNHMTAAELKTQIDVKRALSGFHWRDFYKFSIVRNPFDLMISYWQYKRCSPGQVHHKASLNFSFNDFMFYLLGNQHDNTEFSENKGQHSWLEDEAGDLLLDKVVRLDDLESDYKEVCEKVGIDFQLPTSKNVTSGPYYNHCDYYNSETRDLVSRVFHSDIEKYNFDFRKKNKISLVDKDDGKIVVYCSSLTTVNCGISSYTTMLSKAKKVKSVFRIPEYKNKFPACIHVQYEFGNMIFKELKQVTEYCIEKDIDRWITMHTVMRCPEKNYIRKLKKNIRSVMSLVVRSTQYAICAVLFSRERMKYQGLLKRHVAFNMQHWIRFSIQKYVTNNYNVLVHSEEAKNELIRQGGYPEKIHVQSHPIESYSVSETLHRETDGKFHVGAFGFLSDHKNIGLLLDACELYQGDIILHLNTSVERFQGKIPARLDKIIARAKQLDWVDLNAETLPLDKVVHNLSRNCVNVYLAKTEQCSSSGAIRQYLAAKRPIIAYRSPMVDDVLAYITVIDELSLMAVIDALNGYNEVGLERLNKYIEDNSWELSHEFYSQYLA